VSVNGSWPNFRRTEAETFVFPVGVYSHLLSEHQAFDFTFDADTIKDGWNEIVIFNNAEFHTLITTGRTPTSKERAQLSVRVLSLELGLLPARD
jgi:hypothetical protein